MLIKILKALLFLIVAFIVIVTLGIANGQSSNTPINQAPPNDLVNSLLVMLGGGGIGSLGASAISHQQQKHQQNNQPPEPSGFGITIYTLDEKLKELERRHLRELDVIRTELKKIKSRINYLNSYLEQKNPDFKGRETLY